MEGVVLYFNELSLTAEHGHALVTANAGGLVPPLGETIERLVALRQDAKVAFPLGTLEANCGGRPLRVVLKEHWPREQYRLLLARALLLDDDPVDLGIDVRYNGVPGVGLTLAAVAARLWNHSWALSIAAQGSALDAHLIDVQQYILRDDGEVVGPEGRAIGHLSRADHVDRWQAEIFDWGSAIAASCTLDEIDGHPLVMYPGPKEHGPPHVHLLESRNSHRTLAKFRLDIFERSKGPPTWDGAVKLWVETYQAQLLRSWTRCQRGGLPFALER